MVELQCHYKGVFPKVNLNLGSLGLPCCLNGMQIPPKVQSTAFSCVITWRGNLQLCVNSGLQKLQKTEKKSTIKRKSIQQCRAIIYNSAWMQDPVEGRSIESATTFLHNTLTFLKQFFLPVSVACCPVNSLSNSSSTAAKCSARILVASLRSGKCSGLKSSPSTNRRAG